MRDKHSRAHCREHLGCGSRNRKTDPRRRDRAAANDRPRGGTPFAPPHGSHDRQGLPRTPPPPAAVAAPRPAEQCMNVGLSNADGAAAAHAREGSKLSTMVGMILETGTSFATGMLKSISKNDFEVRTAVAASSSGYVAAAAKAAALAPTLPVAQPRPALRTAVCPCEGRPCEGRAPEGRLCEGCRAPGRASATESGRAPLRRLPHPVRRLPHPLRRLPRQLPHQRPLRRLPHPLRRLPHQRPHRQPWWYTRVRVENEKRFNCGSKEQDKRPRPAPTVTASRKRKNSDGDDPPQDTACENQTATASTPPSHTQNTHTHTPRPPRPYRTDLKTLKLQEQVPTPERLPAVPLPERLRVVPLPERIRAMPLPKRRQAMPLPSHSRNVQHTRCDIYAPNCVSSKTWARIKRWLASRARLRLPKSALLPGSSLSCHLSARWSPHIKKYISRQLCRTYR